MLLQAWTETVQRGVLPLATVLLTLPLTYLVYYVCWRVVFKGPRDSQTRGTKFSLQFPAAAQPHWKGKRVTKMDIRDSEDPQNILSLCPATGQLLGSTRAADPAAIDAAVDNAARAQVEWSKTTLAQRSRVIRTMARFIQEHQAEIASVACRDTGKTMIDASLGEIMVTLEKFNWIIKHGPDALATSRRPGSTNILMFYKGAEVRYEPLGVVCAMVSWNYPLHNMLGPIAAALYTGNGIVVKCSEQVVWSSMFFLQIAKEALRVEGFNPDIVQLLACWPEDAQHLTAHPKISHITFIGSRPVAHHVVADAARALTPVVVELGGKDPLLCLDDLSAPRLREVASIIMRGTFQSAGQNCIGIERVIALPNSYKILEDLLSHKVGELRIGSSLDELGDVDMGALIAGHHIERLESLVKQAVSMGATLVHGGERFVHPKYPQGIYFRPTLLTGVTTEMEIANEEVFGPILLLMRAVDLDDAINIANSTEFGLGSSVFGNSPADLERAARELKCGNVAINDFATFALCQLPFGGCKGSGYGKFGGAEGLRGLCLEKSVCYDKFPLIYTFIPRALDYPIPSTSKAWTIIEGLQDAGYGQGFWRKFRGFRRMIGF